MKSWIDIPASSDFSLHNLPFGIFRTQGTTYRAGVALGDQIIDLAAVTQLGHFNHLSIEKSIFEKPTLNAFIGMGRSIWQGVRQTLQQLFAEDNDTLKSFAGQVLVPTQEATMAMPVEVKDYTDFYSSMEHAMNVGKLFRDPENALLPNWKHLPVAYHGRASSIVISGTDIYRPKGQQRPKGQEMPSFGASKRMDFELETAFIVGKPTKLGQSVGTEEAEEHIFGMVLFNDWSARDIQAWEYQPLGPFLGKNFGSSISPWVVTLDALAPFRTQGPEQQPAVLPYLQYQGRKSFDINLEVAIAPKGENPTTICRSNFKYLYWNMAQQLAHHTVNGCNLNIGDMMASGTISGPTESSFGSMLELSQGGKKPITLDSGQARTFLEDHDTVMMRGYAEKDGMRVGFGEVSSTLLPAL